MLSKNIEERAPEGDDCVAMSFFYIPPEYIIPDNPKIMEILNIIKRHDKQTYLHSIAVASLSYHIAEFIPEINKKEIYCCGLLHDIGKLLIPQKILYKPTKLTDDEFNIIKKHVRYGVEILHKIPECAAYIDIISNHHEREDGTGYPNQNAANKIPIESKVISIADAFDAMTGSRVYRSQKSVKEALIELKKSSGTQFNKEYVDILIDYMQRRI